MKFDMELVRFDLDPTPEISLPAHFKVEGRSLTQDWCKKTTTLRLTGTLEPVPPADSIQSGDVVYLKSGSLAMTATMVCDKLGQATCFGVGPDGALVSKLIPLLALTKKDTSRDLPQGVRDPR